jgi:hypothetical protein
MLLRVGKVNEAWGEVPLHEHPNVFGQQMDMQHFPNW